MTSPARTTSTAAADPNREIRQLTAKLEAVSGRQVVPQEAAA